MRDVKAESGVASTIIVAFGLCVGYILLYDLNEKMMGNEAFNGLSSLIFLPSFVRILGFLMIGLWAIIPLFFAALVCVDLGLSIEHQVVVSLALACGSPLALNVVSSFSGLSPTLNNLTATRLILLTFASAIGSAAAYHFALQLVQVDAASGVTLMVSIIGDALGAWAVIYTLKFALTAVGIILPKQM